MTVKLHWRTIIKTDCSHQLAASRRIIARGTPLLRITGLRSSELWYRGKEKIKGPWHEVDFHPLGDADAIHRIWHGTKACVYHVVDQDDRVLLVGESGGRFDWRWRMSPKCNSRLEEIGSHALFHSTALGPLGTELVKARASGAEGKEFDIVVTPANATADDIVANALSSQHPLVTKTTNKGPSKRAESTELERTVKGVEAWLRTARCPDYLAWNRK